MRPPSGVGAYVPIAQLFIKSRPNNPARVPFVS
jgi:hypothetical protein